MARFFVRARAALRHAWAARGSARWRLVSVGTDTVRVAREGRELEAHAVLEDPRSSGGPGADLGRVSADVLCRSPIDETAYRASAPLVFPDALRAAHPRRRDDRHVARAADDGARPRRATHARDGAATAMIVLRGGRPSSCRRRACRGASQPGARRRSRGRTCSRSPLLRAASRRPRAARPPSSRGR